MAAGLRVSAKFLTAAADARQFPAAGPPEIAFLGRSNVGKSSLINSLLGDKVAKTSSTPGRTRTINFFEIRFAGRPRPDLLFVDLPGYGYAKLPRDVTAEWPKFIEPYLRERGPLALAIVLVDTCIPVQQSDKQMIEWLQAQGRSYLVVGTKADRVSGNALRNALRKMQEEFQLEQILPYSARTGVGKDELWRALRSTTGLDQENAG
ncbi:MAG TPA: ribosome biogenesis GTP-binding protein YihA/YsxC [Terriglobales bacterium]|nr:ribosome biogenesis GTP-binding protein YihA/YsxC [Terriglobales bacterium]